MGHTIGNGGHGIAGIDHQPARCADHRNLGQGFPNTADHTTHTAHGRADLAYDLACHQRFFAGSGINRINWIDRVYRINRGHRIDGRSARNAAFVSTAAAMAPGQANGHYQQ